MTESNGSLAVQLAEATLSETQLANGWQVGYSDREERPYFFNVALGETQWESPSSTESGVTGDDVTDGPIKEQKPGLPKFPPGLRPPSTPVAASHTKDVFKFPPPSAPEQTGKRGIKRGVDNMVSSSMK